MYGKVREKKTLRNNGGVKSVKTPKLYAAYIYKQHAKQFETLRIRNFLFMYKK